MVELIGLTNDDRGVQLLYLYMTLKKVIAFISSRLMSS